MFTFNWVMLLISGLIMIITGAWTVQTRKLAGVLNIVFGLAFFAYGAYLALFFTGGTYFISIKAFIVPFLAVGYAVRDRRAAKALTANKQAAMAAQWQTAPAQMPAQYAPAPMQPAPTQAGPGASVQPAPFQPSTHATPLQPSLNSDDVLGR